jgi:hypothetical protein
MRSSGPVAAARSRRAVGIEATVAQLLVPGVYASAVLRLPPLAPKPPRLQARPAQPRPSSESMCLQPSRDWIRASPTHGSHGTASAVPQAAITAFTPSALRSVDCAARRQQVPRRKDRHRTLRREKGAPGISRALRGTVGDPSVAVEGPEHVEFGGLAVGTAFTDENRMG